MSLDDHIRQALDRATAAVRANLETEFAALSDELKRAAAEERSRAAQHAAETAAAEVRKHAEAHIAQLHEAAARQADDIRRAIESREAAEQATAEVRQQAEAQIAQLREAAARQADEIKRAAEAQVGQLKTSLHAQLDDVRRTAQEQVDEARRQAYGEVEQVRHAAAAQVEDARRLSQREMEDARRIASAQVDDVQRRSEQQIDEMRAHFDAQVEEARKRGRADLDALRAEMEAARVLADARAEEVIISQLATAQAQSELRVSEAAERARTDADQAHLAHAARLLEAIRTIDDARALGEVLDALTECAGREVERAAVLVVRNDRLRGWRLAGFPDAGPAKNIELDLDAAGLAGAVVRTGVAVSRPTVAPGDEQGTRQPALPPFAQTAGARHAIAMPIIVGGQVVAVLYADAPRLDTPSSASRWPAVLETLARHSSRALEAMTVQQAAGFSLPRPVARASHGALPGPIEQGGSGDEDAARRYARLLLSEIRMYHEPLVDAGRKSRDLRTRLRGEIDRARRLYEARVPPAVREQSDYFEQELVRTLADGDRTLLG